MRGTSSNARSVATGAAVGAVILGLGGRLATAAVALVLGVPANLSAAGLVESVIVGSIWGAVGTMVLVGEDRTRASRAPRGVVTGIVTFLGSMLFATALGHGPDLGRAEGRVTTLTVAAVFVLFGLALGRAIPVRRTG
jgi:hypothetical protein